MTYLAVCKDGERGGRYFGSWSGVLGPEQHDPTGLFANELYGTYGRNKS